MWSTCGEVWSTCGDVWSHVEMCGRMCGHVWRCVERCGRMCGGVWRCVEMCGDVWAHVWLRVEMCGDVWAHVWPCVEMSLPLCSSTLPHISTCGPSSSSCEADRIPEGQEQRSHPHPPRQLYSILLTPKHRYLGSRLPARATCFPPPGLDPEPLVFAMLLGGPLELM